MTLAQAYGPFAGGQEHRRAPVALIILPPGSRRIHNRRRKRAGGPGKACRRVPAAFIPGCLRILLQVTWNCVFPAGGRFGPVPSATGGNGWANYELPELRDLHQPSRFCGGKGMYRRYPEFVKIEFWFG